MEARRMSAREARANFSDLLGRVYYTKEPVIVEKKGRPFAVVINPEDYEWLLAEREKAWNLIRSVQERNADRDPDQVLRDTTAEVEAVRQEMNEERRRTTQKRR
jgi:prevent-host-death family protein